MKDKLEILLSCMHQTVDIIERSNIKCNATIVNQCDKDDKRMFEFYSNEETSMINWIDSSERGLSRSRNMALHSASCDYCLISDDDEVFVDGIDKIIEAELPKGWVIVQSLATVDSTTFDLYMNNMRAMMQEQVFASDVVIFNRTDDE